MKLNPDCIRDILIDVESKTTYNSCACYSSEEDFQELTKYSINEILYHVRQAEASGFFLKKVSYFMDGGCLVEDLSPLGHEFLANIRKDTNWNKTKEIANKVGSSSLDTIKDIASQVIANLISNQFGK